MCVCVCVIKDFDHIMKTNMSLLGLGRLGVIDGGVEWLGGI